MNPMIKFNILVFGIFTIIISGCSRDPIIDPNTPIHFTTHAAYIVSDGTSSTQAGLSLYDFRTGSYNMNIFTPGTPVPFANDIVVSGSNLFMISTGNLGDGMVYLLDSAGNVLNSVSLGSAPSGIAVASGKLYVSTAFDSSVTVLNTGTLSFIKKIKAGYFPEKLIGYSDKVFACNTRTLGGLTDNRVTVIDAAADSVIKQIRVSPYPSSVILSNDKKIIVGCKSTLNAVMYKIDPISLSVIDSLILPNGFVSDMSLNSVTNEIFFIQDVNHIGLADFVSRNILTVITVNEPGASITGYAYDAESAKHCIGASFSITVNGKFYLYSSTGILEKSFDTFANPSKIAIKNIF